MAKTKIIVEDNNDKFTYQAIINHMKLTDISVDVEDIDWETSSAESNPEKPTGLIKVLSSHIKEIKKGNIEQIGIIWDIDTDKDKKLATIKTAISAAFPDAKVELFETENEFGTITFDPGTAEEIVVKIACHLVGLNGSGEIEDILKAIKTEPSLLADCINENLPHCLKELALDVIKEKDLVKLWINSYIRYDTLQKNKRKDKYTKWENVMKDRANVLFDFDKVEIPELVKLKEFLTIMTN